MTKKEKVLNFVKEHENGIKAITATVCLVGLSFGAGYLVSRIKLGDKVIVTDDRLAAFLLDAQSKHNPTQMFIGIRDDDKSMVTKNLGELGVEMIEKFKVPEDQDFTHVLLLGKSKD
jgi:hypothetical protein